MRYIRVLVLGILAISLALIRGQAQGQEDSCVWKTTDIIDARIDIGAQKSLMRQMSAGTPKSREASAMIGAIKKGELAGILLPPRKAVSDRAKRMNPKRGYWEILGGKTSVCLHEPAGEPPLIGYREKLADAQIDDALRNAWAQCQLPTPDPPCLYVVDAWQPESECEKDQDCIDKGLGWICKDRACIDCETNEDCISGKRGHVCNQQKQCEFNFEPDKAPDCVQCDPETETIYRLCPDGWECSATKKCCIPPDGKEHRCYEKIHKEWRAANRQCEDAEKGALVECGIEAAKCSAGDALACAESIKCGHESYTRKEKCKRDKYDEFKKKQKECYG